MKSMEIRLNTQTSHRRRGCSELRKKEGTSQLKSRNVKHIVL